jgi:hypothetical protein
VWNRQPDRRIDKNGEAGFLREISRFFAVAKNASPPVAEGNDSVESAMVRHHYGPWDKRYYHVLAYLEARQLIEVVKKKNGYLITLTPEGRRRATALAGKPSFASLVERMRAVKNEFGSKSGSTLKKLIYNLFDEEVGKKPLGEVIRR